MRFLLAINVIALASGCTARAPIVSHKGTEPPEPAHSKPDPDAAAPRDPNQHEDGELEVESGKWEFPVAVTERGMLWGTIEESRGGKRILAFRGIRYAQPPVGEKRFRPPVPYPKWEGIVEAKGNGHVCPQHMFYKPDVWIGNEDCLFLNVFTRDLVVKKSRPVIVWIHGGSFVRGSAAEYDPDYVLDEDVVLVTVQYRLGMFGFLSTEDGEAPGNYGMLDQVAALKWVKENVHAFSGNPNSITVMGQEAGGASVHYHLLSPLSRGLFNRAVSMSGTALCWWASLKRPLERAKKLARLQDCPYNVLHDGRPFGDVTTKALVECLRGKTMEQLMNTHPNFYEWKHLEQAQEPTTSWSPRVDAAGAGGQQQPSFMPAEPVDLMEKGNFQHVPWVVGITDDEGALKASTLFHDVATVDEFNVQFEKLGPLAFGFHDGQTEAPKVQAKRVKDHYWGAELTFENAKGLVDAISDSAYSHPIDAASKLHAMKSKARVFVYHFGYKGAHSLTQLSANAYPPKKVKSDIGYGVGNGDDLIYLFPVLSGAFRPLPRDDLVFSQRFIELLTSFARDGKPVIKMGTEEEKKRNEIADGKEDDEKEDEDGGGFVWNPVTEEHAAHLDIGNEMEMDDGLPNHQRMKFWQEMPAYWTADRENYKPAPPVVFKDEL